MGGGEVHQHNVGIHAFFEHAAFFGAALSSGTADGGHHQCRRSGQGIGFPGSAAHLQSDIAHHFKQIHIAAFHGTAGAQCHIHAGFYAGQHIGVGIALLGAGHGGDGGGCLEFAQHSPVGIAEAATAGGGGGNPEKPMAA